MYRTTGYPIDLALRTQSRAQRRPRRLARLIAFASRLAGSS